MEETPEWFRYPHLIIPIAALGLLYPIYTTFHHVFYPNKNDECKRLSLTKTSKYLLLISVIVSYSYLFITLFQTIFMFIPNNISAYSPKLCPYLATLRMFTYATGRSLCYGFFISRANDTFKDTYLEFKTKTKIYLSMYIIFFINTIVIGAAYIYFALQNWIIYTNPHKSDDGSYCLPIDSNINASKYLKYLFVWGTLNDIIYAFITIFILISKLFTLIIESENSQKSVHDRFSIKKQLSDIKSDIETEKSVLSGIPAPAAFPELQITDLDYDDDPEPPMPDINVLTPKRDSFPELQLNIQADTINSIRSISNTSAMTPEPPSVNKTSKSPRNLKLQNKLGAKVSVSKSDAVTFHEKTHDQNKIILLISKFFILLVCVVVSSQIVLIIFIVFRGIVLALYSLDTMINMICLYLSFIFSDNLYNKICGRWCTPHMFPIIKTFTMQCSSYERDYKARHNGKDISKWCVYCKCFFLCGCCYSDDITFETTRETYTLAKYEVELMVSGAIGRRINYGDVESSKSSKKSNLSLQRV